MTKDKVRIPIKTLQKMYDNCNHGGVFYYDNKYKVGSYQMVDSWEEKPQDSWTGQFIMIIKDLKRKGRYYMNKARLEIDPDRHASCAHNHIINKVECVRVKKKLKGGVEWIIKTRFSSTQMMLLVSYMTRTFMT